MLPANIATTAEGRSHSAAQLWLVNMCPGNSLHAWWHLTRRAARSFFPDVFSVQRPPPAPATCAQPPPLVCAHGGDTTGGAIANTRPAYRAALAQGYQCIEARSPVCPLCHLAPRPSLSHCPPCLAAADCPGPAVAPERRHHFLACAHAPSPQPAPHPHAPLIPISPTAGAD